MKRKVHVLILQGVSGTAHSLTASAAAPPTLRHRTVLGFRGCLALSAVHAQTSVHVQARPPVMTPRPVVGRNCCKPSQKQTRGCEGAGVLCSGALPVASRCHHPRNLIMLPHTCGWSIQLLKINVVRPSIRKSGGDKDALLSNIFSYVLHEFSSIHQEFPICQVVSQCRTRNGVREPPHSEAPGCRHGRRRWSGQGGVPPRSSIPPWSGPAPLPAPPDWPATTAALIPLQHGIGTVPEVHPTAPAAGCSGTRLWLMTKRKRCGPTFYAPKYPPPARNMHSQRSGSKVRNACPNMI